MRILEHRFVRPTDGCVLAVVLTMIRFCVRPRPLQYSLSLIEKMICDQYILDVSPPVVSSKARPQI
jgi:hypothetical protein